MARYGDFRYGSRLYGAIDRGVARSFLNPRAVSYGAVRIEIEADTRVGSGYALVRTANGAAEDPSQGVVVSSGEVVAPYFVESDTNLSGTEVAGGTVYYTLFVFDESGSWTKDAATSVVVPKDYNTWRTMAVNLPRAFTSVDGNPISVADYGTPLMRFLRGMAVTHDEWMTYLDMASPALNRSRFTTRWLHDAFARSAGMPIESTLGLATSRRLFREAGMIYRDKGTTSGLVRYAEALTGWNIDLIESTNLLLSREDSSFEEGTGNWGVTGGTFSQMEADGGAVTIPAMPYEDPTNAFDDRYVGRVAQTTTTTTLTLPSDKDRVRAVPVTEGDTYWLKVPVRQITGATSVVRKIEWLDQFGVTISTSTSTSANSTTSWATLSYSATAPAGARFAVIQIVITGASSRVLDIDMICFASSDTHYREPRSIDIVCSPTRLNLLSNPSFEVAGSWTAGTGTFTRPSDSLLGTYSGLCTGTPYRTVGETIPALPGRLYTLSGYVKGTGTARLVVEWLDSGGSVIVIPDPPLDPLIEYAPGEEPEPEETNPEVTATADWERIERTFTSPDNAVNCRVVLEGSGTVNYDALVFEVTDRTSVYFDYATSDSSGEDAKTLYKDTHTYSALYPNRLVKMIRLRETAQYYLPLGVRSRVLLWDSPDPDVKDLIPYGSV
jgi:hypothetical protein